MTPTFLEQSSTAREALKFSQTAVQSLSLQLRGRNKGWHWSLFYASSDGIITDTFRKEQLKNIIFWEYFDRFTRGSSGRFFLTRGTQPIFLSLHKNTPF